MTASRSLSTLLLQHHNTTTFAFTTAIAVHLFRTRKENRLEDEKIGQDIEDRGGMGEMARPQIIGPDSGPEPPFPLRMGGKVVSGFGRGSKEVIPIPSIILHLPSHSLSNPLSRIFPAASANAPSSASQQPTSQSKAFLGSRTQKAASTSAGQEFSYPTPILISRKRTTHPQPPPSTPRPPTPRPKTPLTPLYLPLLPPSARKDGGYTPW